MNLTRLQDSRLVTLRPTRLLPPKRLSTPRSARRLSTTSRGLLPGSPAITRTGLAPARLVQLLRTHHGRRLPDHGRGFKSWEERGRRGAACSAPPAYGSTSRRRYATQEPLGRILNSRDHRLVGKQPTLRWMALSGQEALLLVVGGRLRLRIFGRFPSLRVFELLRRLLSLPHDACRALH